jgi:hypothetical protein
VRCRGVVDHACALVLDIQQISGIGMVRNLTTFAAALSISASKQSLFRGVSGDPIVEGIVSLRSAKYMYRPHG